MNVLNFIAQTIFDKKGMNILALDVRNCPTMADYVLIAEGSADVHVKAIARALQDGLGEFGCSLDCCQGIQEGDWVVLDAFWFVIHLFKPGFREKYDLESLWTKAEIVDLVIDVCPTISVGIK